MVGAGKGMCHISYYLQALWGVRRPGAWAMDLQGQGGETGVPEAASNLRGNLRLKPLASHNISISLCLGFFIYTHFLVSKVLARKKP